MIIIICLYNGSPKVAEQDKNRNTALSFECFEFMQYLSYTMISFSIPEKDVERSFQFGMKYIARRQNGTVTHLQDKVSNLQYKNRCQVFVIPRLIDREIYRMTI